MKPKTRKLVAPRNPFVAAAMFKKAGTHKAPQGIAPPGENYARAFSFETRNAHHHAE